MSELTPAIQPRCPICGALDAQQVLDRGPYRVVRCQRCQLQYAHPMPTPDDLAAYYQDLAYFEGSATEGYADYAGMEQVLRPLAERRLRQIETRTDGPGRVLDLGCAGGFFLDQARRRGWQIAGVELSQPMAERAVALLQIPIATNLAELTDPHGTFDVITLWEVIEHLPDPLAVLAQLRFWLKPGGWLALSTPNTGHWQALAAPDQWTSYRPPAHVLYLAEPTLRSLLAQAGFTAVQIWRSGPRPYLPGWLDRVTQPLQQGLADGSAKSWRWSLYAWRAIRLGALLTYRFSASRRDVHMTLEAIGRLRP